jgi:hypothetical protein
LLTEPRRFLNGTVTSIYSVTPLSLGLWVAHAVLASGIDDRSGHPQSHAGGYVAAPPYLMKTHKNFSHGYAEGYSHMVALAINVNGVRIRGMHFDNPSRVVDLHHVGHTHFEI